jgi:hypothetical protein
LYSASLPDVGLVRTTKVYFAMIEGLLKNLRAAGVVTHRRLCCVRDSSTGNRELSNVAE